MMVPGTDRLTVPELAARWRCSTKTVLRKIHGRDLPVWGGGKGRDFTIPLEGVLAYEASHKLIARGRPAPQSAGESVEGRLNRLEERIRVLEMATREHRGHIGDGGRRSEVGGQGATSDVGLPTSAGEAA